MTIVFQTPNYLIISNSVTSAIRLRRLREFAAAEVAKHGDTYANPHCPTPKTWREARRWGFGNWRSAYCAGLNQGFNSHAFGNGPQVGDKEPVWYCHAGACFRGEQFSDECDEAPRYVRDHKGWYSDTDASETVRGIVARLPHGRFIAGYYWSNNDERVYFQTVYDNECDAAIAANAHAEKYAEICREDNEQYEAAQKLERDIESHFARLRECLALRHRACMEYVRDEARDLIEKIREARETLKTDYAEYC
jgi:hypothetical protein